MCEQDKPTETMEAALWAPVLLISILKVNFTFTPYMYFYLFLMTLHPWMDDTVQSRHRIRLEGGDMHWLCNELQV